MCGFLFCVFPAFFWLLKCWQIWGLDLMCPSKIQNYHPQSAKCSKLWVRQKNKLRSSARWRVDNLKSQRRPGLLRCVFICVLAETNVTLTVYQTYYDVSRANQISFMNLVLRQLATCSIRQSVIVLQFFDRPSLCAVATVTLCQWFCL